jgi:hypothetical protein
MVMNVLKEPVIIVATRIKAVGDDNDEKDRSANDSLAMDADPHTHTRSLIFFFTRLRTFSGRVHHHCKAYKKQHTLSSKKRTLEKQTTWSGYRLAIAKISVECRRCWRCWWFAAAL